MFTQLKNIDTAFKHVRLFSLLFLIGNVIICCVYSYNYNRMIQQGQNRIHILLNGKLLDAFSVDRADSLQVEIVDHVKMFHFYFYWLEPNEEVNKKHLTSALYLADNTAYREYENLSESGYYSGIVSGNITEQVEDPDSVVVDINRIPYSFRYYGKLRIVRSTSITTRSLITEGLIRPTTISSKNPHGFLIENWKVLENKNIDTQNR